MFRNAHVSGKNVSLLHASNIVIFHSKTKKNLLDWVSNSLKVRKHLLIISKGTHFEKVMRLGITVKALYCVVSVFHHR